MRIGIYRVVYYVDHSILRVIVIEVSNRGNAYKML